MHALTLIVAFAVLAVVESLTCAPGQGVPSTQSVLQSAVRVVCSASPTL